MRYVNVPEVRLLPRDSIEGSKLIDQVEQAAQRRTSVRILVPPRFMERLCLSGSTVRTSLEVCEFHRCDYAIVEQLENPRARARDATSWLWIEPGGNLMHSDILDLDRAKAALDVVAGTWEAGRRTQTIRLKTAPLDSLYPSLALLDRIRRNGLNDGDDPRSAALTFIATRLLRNWRWDVRVRPV